MFAVEIDVSVVDFSYIITFKYIFTESDFAPSQQESEFTRIVILLVKEG